VLVDVDVLDDVEVDVDVELDVEVVLVVDVVVDHVNAASSRASADGSDILFVFSHSNGNRSITEALFLY
jgi:hypothetical protein